MIANKSNTHLIVAANHVPTAACPCWYNKAATYVALLENQPTDDASSSGGLGYA